MMRSSYKKEDVTLLLKDITGLVKPLPAAEREPLIQSGVHYCEMLPLEKKPTEKYLKLYEEIKEYCKKYFLDTEHGEWYGYLHYDNTVSTTLKGNIFKGPFHIPRLYMIMAVLDEDGKIDRYAQ